MKKWLFSFVAVPFVLVGCSSGEQTDQADLNNSEIDVAALEVKVDILTPEKVALNETVELAAHVHQNNKNLDDATVKFEVWESGYRDEGQMIEGKLDADGVYKAETTFDHDGVYFMYAHTTASNGMHVMPKQQLVVGNPDMSRVKEDDSDGSMMDMGEHGEQDSTDTEQHDQDSSEDSTDHSGH
ncbi:FixH family protein [Ureibacillus sp. MALMAid1270]|uniref:FixH family protein n=1 Tax=Ureibacillus sp. MALMAid1270 TaxID=3411629 RepID=UPI003BA793A1